MPGAILTRVSRSHIRVGTFEYFGNHGDTEGVKLLADIRAVFTEAEVKPYKTAEAAREALHRGETDLLFGDGFALSFWLNGTDSGNCCEFVGGPFLESRYFGEGIGVAVKRGNDTLRLAINWALFRLWEKGRYTDLWLRYFPINPY